MWQQVAGPFSTKGLALQQLEMVKADNPKKAYRVVYFKSRWWVEANYNFDTGYERNAHVYAHRPESGE